MNTEPGIETLHAPWDRLRELTTQGDAKALQAFLKDLEPLETVRALFRLSAEEQELLVELLPPQHAAELIEDLPDFHAADIIERLEPDAAADIVEELDSDLGADLLAEIAPRDAQAILDEMEAAQARKVRDLISYPPEVAGGLMSTEYYAYP
ncbi:MAG: magnesium transporter, partial [Gammaproteobacteria bacterium]|nr:magnesium transporter [Gammaproteobacteria bacterium]